MADSHKPPGSPPPQDLTGTTVGRFAIRARLGGGGMGEVYRAEDSKLRRPVALKRVAPQLRADDRYRQRLLKEAERASALSDAHIAGIYDVLEQDSELFLVMEYVEGETLRQRLARPLSVAEFLETGMQCAEALVAAHARGIVHRDLKPENIMLTPTGQVKILDFGVAKRLPRPEETASTETLESATGGGLSGTPAYMAPEALLEKETDGRADIFSLGVVFYEALTGRHPFRAGSFLGTSDRILHETPAPLTELNPRAPAELERMVAKMLAKRPEERYATAADLLVDLRSLQRGERFRPESRLWWRWGVALGVAVALAVAVLVPPVRDWLLCALTLCPVPAQKSLAVLPCKAIGGGAENQASCDGLTETVTARLTQLTLAPTLQVAPASEVRARKVASVEEARTELGANLVLEASWERFGESVRINLVLVEARTARQLRTETITAAVADPFGLQDRVVASVARMLDLTAQPQLEGRGTALPTAYDFYLQGRGYLQNYDKPENIENAIRLFQRALDADPRYALAQAGLGEAYWKKYETSKEMTWVEPARQACEQSVALQPELPAAHGCLGTLLNGTGQYEKAAAEFRRGLEIEPTSDEAYRGLGRAYEHLNQWAEAERTYKKAIEVRPHYWVGYNWLGALYFRQARYAEAARMFEQVVALAPDNHRGYYLLGAMYYFLEKPQEAIAAYERSLALRPSYQAASNLGTLYFYDLGDYARAAKAFEQAVALNNSAYKVWGNLGAARVWLGDAAGARAAFTRAVELAEAERTLNPRAAEVLGDLADYYASLGQKEKALPLLQQALKLAPDDAVMMFKAASVYEGLGQRDKALAWLERAIRKGYSRKEIERAPGLKQLRADARYQRLRERLIARP
ncbi:MAG: tetratricopeptide repeat protein [Acidobacteria bacterium]|nr:tetratricopeptide repeat protein [Acidobacteriota bacterium]